MNLLKETLDVLAENNKTEQDVIWIGNKIYKTTWDNFKAVADIEYNNGFGGQEVAEDLLVVGIDWWLERHEYDGSEWWEFKTLLIEPKNTIEIKALTREQSLAEYSYMITLLEMNNIKTD